MEDSSASETTTLSDIQKAGWSYEKYCLYLARYKEAPQWKRGVKALKQHKWKHGFNGSEEAYDHYMRTIHPRRTRSDAGLRRLSESTADQLTHVVVDPLASTLSSPQGLSIDSPLQHSPQSSGEQAPSATTTSFTAIDKDQHPTRISASDPPVYIAAPTAETASLFRRVDATFSAKGGSIIVKHCGECQQHFYHFIDNERVVGYRGIVEIAAFRAESSKCWWCADCALRNVTRAGVHVIPLFDEGGMYCQIATQQVQVGASELCSGCGGSSLPLLYPRPSDTPRVGPLCAWCVISKMGSTWSSMGRLPSESTHEPLSCTLCHRIVQVAHPFRGEWWVSSCGGRCKKHFFPYCQWCLAALNLNCICPIVQ